MKIVDEQFYMLLRQFLTIYLPRQKCYSDNTIRAYRMAYNLLFDFLRDVAKIPVEQIGFASLTRTNVLGYLDWLETERHCCISTRNQRLFSLMSFLQYAASDSPELTACLLDLKKIPVKKAQSKPVQWLSANALKALLKQPDTKKTKGIRDQFLMILMYDTGARIQEILSLKTKDIVITDDNPHVYLSGKGNKIRIVPIMEKTVLHYANYLKVYHADLQAGQDRHLFYTVIHGQKHQMSPDTVASFMRRYALLAKNECADICESIHPHMMRHTRAMDLYRGGMPLPLVQQFLGHTDLKSTLIYAYADTDMKREAMRKADPGTLAKVNVEPVWLHDEQLLRKLCGLR